MRTRAESTTPERRTQDASGAAVQPKPTGEDVGAYARPSVPRHCGSDARLGLTVQIPYCVDGRGRADDERATYERMPFGRTALACMYRDAKTACRLKESPEDPDHDAYIEDQESRRSASVHDLPTCSCTGLSLAARAHDHPLRRGQSHRHYRPLDRAVPVPSAQPDLPRRQQGRRLEQHRHDRSRARHARRSHPALHRLDLRADPRCCRSG